MLKIVNLQLSINNKVILNDLSLHIKHGETHVIMGKNGSGKTSLGLHIAGHTDYIKLSGMTEFEEKPLEELSISQRANAGIFLGFQHPIEIPGLTGMNFLREAHNFRCKANNQEKMPAGKFLLLIKKYSAEVGLDFSIIKRHLNVGLSGGEKKRFEILQIKLFQPKLCIFDETDAGLDVDALKIIENVIKERQQNNLSQLIITHHTNLIDKINFDKVHLLQDGKIKKSGGKELAMKIASAGYKGNEY